jgi:hypothetical protein
MQPDKHIVPCHVVIVNEDMHMHFTFIIDPPIGLPQFEHQCSCANAGHAMSAAERYAVQLEMDVVVFDSKGAFVCRARFEKKARIETKNG